MTWYSLNRFYIFGYTNNPDNKQSHIEINMNIPRSLAFYFLDKSAHLWVFLLHLYGNQL